MSTVTRILQLQPIQLRRTPDLLQELASFQEIFREHEDPRSMQLHAWINTTLSSISEDSLSSITTIEEVAQRQLEALGQLLLTDVNVHMPTDPILENRQWVWERAELEAYQQEYGNLSPHNGETIQVDEHPFIKAMIVWFKQLVIEDQQPVENRLSSATTPGTQELFEKMATTARTLAATRSLQEMIIQLSATYESSLATVKASADEETVRQNERLEKHYAETAQTVEHLEEQHKKRAAAQEAAQRDVEQRAVAVAGRCNVQDAQIRDQQRCLQQNRETFDALVRRVQQLESEIGNTKTICTVM